MRARGWHQGCNALDQLQWREYDFIYLCAPLVVGFADSGGLFIFAGILEFFIE
jgi:hypothetical protein